MAEPTPSPPAPPPRSVGPDVILASASPRRRELLERVGLRLRVCPADIDETPHAGELAADYVRRMARQKGEAAMASDVTRAESASVPVLSADTSVVIEGHILGKPADPDEARTMLRRLAGRRHEVLSAYRIRLGSREVERSVTTTVAIRLLDPAEIEAYVACEEWRGKAGGYAIQGVASAFVSELRGSLTNVVGLPLAEALADLRALGGLASYPPSEFPRLP